MLPVLMVAGALVVTAQIHRFGGGVIASEMHHVFGLGAAEIGLIMGAMPLASAVVQVPIGLAFDRFGTRLTVSWVTLVALLGTLILAFSTAATGLWLGRFLIGAGNATTVAALLLLAMRWAPPERYASVAGATLASASMVGGFLATVPLDLLFNSAQWQTTFLLISLLTLVVNVLCFTVLRDGPPGSDSEGGRRESLAESLAGMLATLADRHVRRIVAMATCVIAPFMCVAGLWAGPYLQVVHGLTPTEASWVLLAMITTGNLGMFVYGPLDRWIGGRRKVVLGGAVATMALVAALALWPSPSLWLVVVLFLLFAAASAFYVTLTAHARSFVPIARSGRTIATINMMALTAAFAAQWLTGLLVALPGSDGLGTESGFRLAFGFIALMLLGAVLVYRTAPEQPEPSLRSAER